jgi:hypothetical protein
LTQADLTTINDCGTGTGQQTYTLPVIANNMFGRRITFVKSSTDANEVIINSGAGNFIANGTIAANTQKRLSVYGQSITLEIFTGTNWVVVSESNPTPLRSSIANQVSNTTLTVDKVNGSNIIDFTQTTANITLTIPAPTQVNIHKILTLENLPASTTSLAFTAVGGDSFSIAPSQSVQILWNGTSWRLLNPAQALAETGVTTLSSQFTIVSATDTDVTGLNVTLPSAGKYEFIVSYMVRNSVAGAYQRMRILNTANTLLDTIEAKAPVANDSAYVEITRVLQYTGTLGEVIRVQLASNGTATAQLMSDLVGGQTKIAWKKISGFSPVVGQTVNFINAFVGQTTTNLAPGTDHVKFATVNANSGNGITLDTTSPYSSAVNTASLGRFTVKAGITARLAGNLGDISYTSGPANYVTFRWFNSDTNTAVGEQTTVNSDFGGGGYDGGGGFAVAIVSPTVDTRYELRIAATG